LVQTLVTNLAHSWEWEPKTGKVTFDGEDKDGKPVKVTYLRSELNSQPANVKDEIDPAFMNDQYWLIFPFHVIWDASADVQDKGKQKLPLGKGSADQIIVKYPSDVGYTPGDTWNSFSVPTAAWNSSTAAAGRKSRVSSSQLGRATRRPVLSLSRLNIAERPTASRCASSSPTCLSSLAGSDTWIKAQ
jgi:hypothetical protein